MDYLRFDSNAVVVFEVVVLMIMYLCTLWSSMVSNIAGCCCGTALVNVFIVLLVYINSNGGNDYSNDSNHNHRYVTEVIVVVRKSE